MGTGMRIKKISAVMVVLAVCCAAVLCSCQEETTAQNQPATPEVVSAAIPKQPAAPEKIELPPPEKIPPLAPGRDVESAVGQPPPPQLDPDQKELVANLIMGQGKKYEPKVKTDPFAPLVQEEPLDGTGRKVEIRAPSRPLTPLEKMELSQLKLVAVLETNHQKLAMVEESSGKGYEVKVGTYIGKNSGKVTQIKSGSIVIKEVIRDYKGKPKERFQEMKLHKEDGE